MTITSYIEKYLPYAQKIQNKYGVPIEVSLAQSALESGWGKKAPGNMMFGIKAGSNWNGKKQLIYTTEYHSTKSVKYPEIISITKLATGKYLYKVKDWFRAYDTPQGSFNDYAELLQTSRYKKAFAYKDEPYRFIKEVANGGYATSPNYYGYMVRMINAIKWGLKKKGWIKCTCPNCGGIFYSPGI